MLSGDLWACFISSNSASWADVRVKGVPLRSREHKLTVRLDMFLTWSLKYPTMPRKCFTDDTLWGRGIDKMASVPFFVGKRPSGVMRCPKISRLSEKRNI